MNTEENIVITRSINAFSLNFGEYYYEGQTVNLIDSKFGSLTNVVIKNIFDNFFIMNVVDNKDNVYKIDLRTLIDIECVERRMKIAL